MNHTLLKSFIEKSAASKNLQVKKKADELLDTMVAEQAAEQVADPQLQGQNSDSAHKEHTKDVVDQLILPAFPELAEAEPEDSTFGKKASAFVSDITLKDLPKDTKDDIGKLVPINNPNAKIVQYGMVVDELLPKVDSHNFDTAEEHIKKDTADKGKRAMGDKFQDKIKTKYILLLNDRIIDGHHYLALAKALGITCSLRVLDLTSMRFQEKKASLYSLIKTSHGQNNDSRKGGTKVSLNSGASPVFRREGTR